MIRITVSCDALDCTGEFEADYENDGCDMEDVVINRGWGVNYEGPFHYCPRCLPAVIKECQEEGMEVPVTREVRA